MYRILALVTAAVAIAPTAAFAANYAAVPITRGVEARIIAADII